jgi:chorismate mutase/prephenate dehydratase
VDLKSLRNKIDGIDRKIIALLNARAELSVDIGEYKTKKGLSVYSPDREKEVYSKIAGMSRGR